MKFSVFTVLALDSTVRIGDAFVSPTRKYRSTEIGMDKSFIDALSPPSGDDDGDSGDANEDDNQSSSRFRQLMKLAKEEEQNRSSSMQPSGRAIENPFLNPPSTTPALNQLPANPDELSVEEQARMFREMMAGNQIPASPPPPPMRTAKTDRAGRPLGRNPDADKIANTSDLYFAQLKRDSTVRTLGRQRGDNTISEAVFEDDGIKELDNLLLTNPYLKGQKEEERNMLDNLPDEVVAPYFRSDDTAASVKASSGISYKQRLMEKKRKKADAKSTPISTPVQKQEILEVSRIEEIPQKEAKSESSSQVPVKHKQDSNVPEMNSMPSPSSDQHPSAPTPVVETSRPVAVTSSSDTRKQNLRTLMGLLLKHRGGPGFGKGRLKGTDIDLFEGLVEEITNMLRDEARHAGPDTDTSTIQTAEDRSMEERDPSDETIARASQPKLSRVETTEAVSQSEKTPAETNSGFPEIEKIAVVDESAGVENIDSTIACIEGAIAMYQNSPPAIQESVLVTLRAALMSAVDTCNIALASQSPANVVASPDASINSMIACINGAVTMYKNSPPALKESVLVTLRMALMSAVETCDLILSQCQLTLPSQDLPSKAPSEAAFEPTPIAQSASSSDTATIPITPTPELAENDKNNLALEEIYEKLQSASGQGKLGLRNDLAAEEADELANDLADMRDILMEELKVGTEGSSSGQAAAQESSASSRYQQMLAKARAEKELKGVTPDTKPTIDSSIAQGNSAGQESSASSSYQQMLAKARAEKTKSNL